MPRGSLPAPLSQSSIWAGESTWSSYLPPGKTVSSCRYSARQPASLGQVDKAVLDHCGLGVHALGEAKLRLTRQALPLATPRAHDLVGLRLVAGDGMQAQLDQFLDPLGARGLVLDQHDTGIEGLGLLAHRALQFGVLRAPAQYMQQIEVLAGDAPARAHAEIAELGRLVGGVPALHDAVESGGQLIGRVSPEPRRLDHAAALRCRHLLVLAGGPGAK